MDKLNGQPPRIVEHRQDGAVLHLLDVSGGNCPGVNRPLSVRSDVGGHERDDLGTFRSPLIFADGRKVETPEDWLKRRKEILASWRKLMGLWPPTIERPTIKFREKKQRDGFTQHKVRIGVAPGRSTTGYLVVCPIAAKCRGRQ